MSPRKLSGTFMQELTHGFLAPIARHVAADPDLNLFIRQNYFNITFKGHSLLGLAEGNGRYRVTIASAFTGPTRIPDLVDPASVAFFLEQVPHLKERIIAHSPPSVEIEYEQALVRANNCELRNTSDYFFIDRKYVIGGHKIDLLGIYWQQTEKRRLQGQTVPLCLVEVKHALNPEVKHIADQIAAFYGGLKPILPRLAAECEVLLQQRLDLDLCRVPRDRAAALKTLAISRRIEDCQIILVLIDDNPRSSTFESQRLAALPFAKQIRVLRTGLAMWGSNLAPLG